MTDIGLLPLPRTLQHADDADLAAHVQDYARANVAHHVAAKDAEIEALKERDEKRGIYIREQWEEIEALRTDRDSFKQQAEHNLSLTERLAEALRDALECGNDGDWQSARQYITAALRDHDQEGDNP